jgi:hypothetical protein
MIKNAALILLGFSLFCSASFAEEAAKSSITPASDNAPTSRLRMFGQNGASAALFRDSACVKSFWSDDAEKVSGGFSSAFSSFVGTASNTSLGIAETDTTRNLSKKDGMLSKAYFREYVIRAEKPSSMRMGFRDVSSFYVANGIRYDAISPSCNGAISFTPHAGEDYEAAFSWEGKSCRLSMNQVVVKDGKTELIPVPVTLAPDC